MLEKRKYRRFPVLCKAESIDAEVIVLDMSREGMNIKSSYYFENRNNISFSLVFPNFDIIKIVCDIIWDTKNEDNDYHYGLEIIKISKEHEATYLLFIDELRES